VDEAGAGQPYDPAGVINTIHLRPKCSKVCRPRAHDVPLTQMLT
jgi:hypothetical protein